MKRRGIAAKAIPSRQSNEPTNELSAKNLLLHDTLYREGELILHKFKIRDYRNRLGYGADANVMAFGSFIGFDSYTDSDLDALIQKLESTYQKLFAD